MEDERFDAIVVGAGPAGITVAKDLAAAGLSGLSLAAYVLVREEGITVVPTALAAVGAMPVMYAVRNRPWRRAGLGRWVRQAAVRTLPSALVLVLALDLVSKACGEVLFIADHHINVLGKITVHVLSLSLAADRPPQRIPVVEVVGDDRTVLFGDLHRFFCDFRRRL